MFRIFEMLKTFSAEIFGGQIFGGANGSVGRGKNGGMLFAVPRAAGGVERPAVSTPHRVRVVGGVVRTLTYAFLSAAAHKTWPILYAHIPTFFFNIDWRGGGRGGTNWKKICRRKSVLLICDFLNISTNF